MMKRLLPILLFLLPASAGAVVISSTTAGLYDWTVPAGISSVTIECWGAGGSGGGRATSGGSGGGGGGAYSLRRNYPVSAAQTYQFIVPTGGSAGNAGGYAVFGASLCYAKGGAGVATDAAAGGAGGDRATSTGTIRFAGGAGYTYNSGGYGGGGGGSGGMRESGINTGATNATSNAGAAAVWAGGPGGAGSSGAGNGASPTSGPDDGGGGAYRTSKNTYTGGQGATGKVRLSYTTSGVGYDVLQSTFTKKGSAAASSVAQAFPSNESAGSLNILSISFCDDVSCTAPPAETPTVTDTQGNHYDKAVGPGSGNTALFIYYGYAQAGANTITVDCGATVYSLSVYMDEWTGLAAAGALDQSGVTNATGANGSVTTAGNTDTANELVWAVMTAGQIPDPLSGIQIMGHGGTVTQWANADTSGQAYTASWLFPSANYYSAIATFRPAGYVPPAPSASPGWTRRRVVIE